MCVCVCVIRFVVRVRVRVCVYVCVVARDVWFVSWFVCVCEREGERESVCVPRRECEGSVNRILCRWVVARRVWREGEGQAAAKEHAGDSYEARIPPARPRLSRGCR